MSAEFDIALNQIVIGKRLRPYDEAHGALIAASMEARGQLQAIEVSPAGKDRWHLVFGLHRIGGAKINGWKSIRAKKFEGDADARELREIEENLMRSDLNALDRAFSVERWLHHLGAIRKGGADEKSLSNQSFAKVAERIPAELAEKANLSERSIYRDLKLARLLAPIRDKIAAHPIADSHADLMRLAKLDGPKRTKALAGLEAGKPFKEVVGGAAKSDAATRDKELSALIALWRKTSKKTKAAFVKAHRPEIVDLLDNHGAARG